MAPGTTLATPLVALVAAQEPGDVVVLTIERGQREMKIEVRLGERPAPDKPGATWEG
jgi:S1-C subfamily serine protease